MNIELERSQFRHYNSHYHVTTVYQQLNTVWLVRIFLYAYYIDSVDSDGQTVRKEIHHRKDIANVCGKDNTTSNNMRNMARSNAYIATLNTYKQMGITGAT